jgi:hypothetical protein
MYVSWEYTNLRDDFISAPNSCQGADKTDENRFALEGEVEFLAAGGLCKGDPRFVDLRAVPEYCCPATPHSTTSREHAIGASHF